MYSIDIKFDDQSTDTIDYPSPDSQILTVKGDKAIVETEGGGHVVACGDTLDGLSAGDLVDGRYQDGAENGAWFRGRVASVNSESGLCDVVYYDREVSSFVVPTLLSYFFSHSNVPFHCHASTNKISPSLEQICAESSEDVQT